MLTFQRYIHSQYDFSMNLFELSDHQYKLAVLKEFSSNVNVTQLLDPITLQAATSLGIIHPSSTDVFGSDLYLAIEAIVESISKSILEFITKIINGFVELIDSSIEYQKETINHTHQAINKLSKVYESKHNCDEVIVKSNIPDFHTFKVRIQSLFIFIKSIFKDELQDLVNKDQLFGLVGNKSFDSYSSVLSKDFTTELQTKLGIVYDDKVEKEKDPTEENTSVSSMRFVAPFGLPFEANNQSKTIKALGYSDISELIKFTKIFSSTILELCNNLPELADSCKNSKVVMEQKLSDGSATLEESEATKIVNTANIWGNATETCIKAITYYTRAYLEIINVLYQSVAK